jgi:hypothetical protein
MLWIFKLPWWAKGRRVGGLEGDTRVQGWLIAVRETHLTDFSLQHKGLRGEKAGSEGWRFGKKGPEEWRFGGLEGCNQ